MRLPNNPNRHQVQATIRCDRFTLHYGNARTPLATVIADPVYPAMWRLWIDGRLSDLCNLSRIRDAAIEIAQQGPPRRDARLFRWKACPPEVLGKPLVRWSAGNGPAHTPKDSPSDQGIAMLPPSNTRADNTAGSGQS